MEYTVPQPVVKVKVRAEEDNVMRAGNGSHSKRNIACKYSANAHIQDVNC
jgi:hypothetical protein